MARNVSGALVHPTSMLGGVRANQVDINQLCRGLSRHFAPAEPTFSHRIDAIGHDGVAQQEICARQTIRDSISLRANLFRTGRSHGLLDRIDAQIYRVECGGEHGRDCRLSGAR